MPDAKNESTESTVPYDISTFKLISILQNNSVRKTITLLGTFPSISEEKAIILFEKKAFKESDVQTRDANETTESDLESKPSFFTDLETNLEFVNNIYGSFECLPTSKINGVKATVIYPATEKHIEKYSICQKFLIQETPELYNDVTLPFITSSQFSLDWVYNILEHKQETERIVYEDKDPETGFVLVPDLKWDGRNVETLYLLAISHKRDIKSLRDLNDSHLPMLRNIRERTAEAIEERYGLNPAQLRMYLHYQPSFYHFHVHINPLRNDAPGIWCEKSHILDTIINNLELIPDYYQRATLPFVVFDGSKLLERYEEKNLIKKSLKRTKPAEVDEKLDEDTPKKRLKCEESSPITEKDTPSATTAVGVN